MGRRRKYAPPPEPKDPRKNKPWNPKPAAQTEVVSMFAHCPQGHVNYRFEIDRGECRVCDGPPSSMG